MNNYILAKFQKKDQQEVKDFVLNILLEEFGFSPHPIWDADLDDPDKKYKENNGIFYILKDKEKVIGTVALIPHSQEEIELKRMYLDSGYRGKGLGKMLMKKALQFAKDNQYKNVILDTWERLQSAQSLYRKFGFKEYKREGEQIFMALQLNSLSL
jgi:putative acetyltransferase